MGVHSKQRVQGAIVKDKESRSCSMTKKANELPSLIMIGEFVRVREGNEWKPAKVTEILLSPRSYMLKQSGKTTEEIVDIY